MAHAAKGAGSAAAKRAAMRNPPEEDPEFQIAPMIDILLVLLVFFMSISSTEVLQQNDMVNLPVAKEAGDKKKGSTQSIVNIYNSLLVPGKTLVELDGKDYENPAAIVPIIEGKLKVNPQMRVVMRADKMVRYEMTKLVLLQLGAAGVQNVTFSVVDKEGSGPAKKHSNPK